MARQLVLIDENEPEWRLDEHTVAVGRRGVAAARAILAAAPRHDDAEPMAHGPSRRAA